MDNVNKIMDDKINDVITKIYDRYNSTCIIDYDNLRIETPEEILHFKSLQQLRLFVLDEILLSMEYCN